MTKPEDLNTPAIVVVGLIASILVFAVVVLLMVVFYQVQAEQDYEKYVSRPPSQLTNIASRQKEKLVSYGWIDEEKQVVHIPIDRAMEIVLEELADDK